MEGNYFEQKNPMKMYLGMAMPVVFGMVISIIYNMADTYFIAMTQNTDLVAGVSVCAPIFTILMAFGNIYGQGGTSVISRLYGQGDLEKTRAVSSFCFYIAVITGILIAAVMIIFQKPLIYALGADTDTYAYARAYYLTMAVGAPFVVVNFIHINLLRTEGKSMLSTTCSVAGILVNVILDPIFIVLLGWGSFGAALASVIGYIVSDTMLFLSVIGKSQILSVNPRLIRIPRVFTLQIFSIGISAAITNWMSSLCMIITNHFLLPYGNDRIAAMGIALKLIMIPQMIAAGMVFGSAPIIGYFYGGRQYKRLKEMMRMILSLVTAVILTMCLLLILAARPIVGLFLHDPSIVSAGTLMMRLQLATMVLGVFVMFVTVTFQASGKAAEALIVSVLRQGVLFLIVIFITANTMGYIGVIAAQTITDVIAAVIVAAAFYLSFYRTLEE